MESLDNDLLKKPKAEETFKLGFSFGITARIFGVILVLSGVALISNLSIGGLFIGSVFLFPGLFLMTAAYGVDIDYTNEYLKEYSKKYGIKTGKWEHMNRYPYITVLSANINYGYGQMITSFVTNTRGNVSNKAYGVYLLTKTHHNRVLVKRINGSFKDAVEEAKILSKKSGKDLVKFAPQRISKRRD